MPGCEGIINRGDCPKDTSLARYRYDPGLRWYFNPKRGMCIPYYFKGCNPDKKVYKKISTCETTCMMIG